jgi:hypothetical protein
MIAMFIVILVVVVFVVPYLRNVLKKNAHDKADHIRHDNDYE